MNESLSLSIEEPMEPSSVLSSDRSGRRYGHLIAVRPAQAADFHPADSRYENRRLYWICRCDCGKNNFVRGYDLDWGITRSCGCLMREHRSVRSGVSGRKGVERIMSIRAAVNSGHFKPMDLTDPAPNQNELDTLTNRWPLGDLQLRLY